jgi:hypothetical protein
VRLPIIKEYIRDITKCGRVARNIFPLYRYL